MDKFEKFKAREDIVIAYEMLNSFENSYELISYFESIFFVEFKKREKFYILLQNYDNIIEGADAHLEKLFLSNPFNFIENNPLEHNRFADFSILITNDYDLYHKYKYVINYEEFIMLCGFKDYEKKLIQLNKSYFPSYDINTFKYFIKVLVGEIVSATMEYNSHEDFYSDADYTLAYSHSISFDGWSENKNFLFFNPFRYENQYNKYLKNDSFELPDLNNSTVIDLEDFFGVNILEIGTEKNQNLNWEWRKNQLRFFHKEKSVRFYITPEILENLNKDKSQILLIETVLDRNHYIEFYVQGLKDNNNKQNIIADNFFNEEEGLPF